MKNLTAIFVLFISSLFHANAQHSGQKLTSISSDKTITSSVVDTSHEELSPYFDGYQKISMSNGWNFSDNQGNVLSINRYDEVRNFVNGFAGVQKNGKWGLINTKGEEVVACVYDLVLNQSSGNVLVLLEDNWSLIAIQSKQIKRLDIDRVLQYDGGKWLVERQGKKGHISTRGEVVWIEDNQQKISPNPNGRLNKSNGPSSTSSPMIQRALNDNPCPVNLDFELGTFTNWSCFLGKVDTIGNVNRIRVNPSAATNNRHVVYSRSNAANFVDPYGLFSKNPPDGSRYAVRLGNTNYNAQAERIRYKIKVPANDSNFSVKYDYAVVFEDPGHTEWSQPRFEARLFDSATNSYVGCASFEYISSSNLPGFAISALDPGVVYKPWSSVFMSMRGYEGKTMYLEFTTADCARGKHWGYAYVDVQSVCGQPLTIGYDCQFPYTVTLDAPPGFQTYNWWNQNFTQILATGEHSSISPGPDTTTRIWLEMIPYQSFGCNDTLSLTISGAFEPTFHVSSQQSYCAPQTLQFYNTNSGAISVTWDFGDGTTFTGDTIMHTYTQAGTYVVNMMVVMPNGCTGTKTDTIKIINPSGTLAYNGGNFCTQPNIQFEVSSNGVQSYSWDFGDGSTAQSSTATITHQYLMNGNYQPTVVLSYGNGCELLLAGQQSILIDSAIASFSDLVIPDCGKAVIELVNTSSQNTSSNWLINGQSFTGNQIQSTAFSEGNTQVRLMVSGSTGCKDTLDRSIRVDFFKFPSGSVRGPSVSCSGEDAVFYPVFPRSDSIRGYTWKINGNTVAMTDTLHWIGSAAGNYQVTCIAVNAHGCSDTIQQNLIVKPKPSLAAINNQSLCAGANTAAINFASTPNGATVNWTNSLPSIGLAATGTGDIASFVAVNTSSSTQTATITVTPSLDGCVGDAITMNIAVKPIPTLTAINNQNLCTGSNTAAINFNSTPSNAIINWTNSLPSIGLSATGTGNIASFVAVNASSTIQTATITATPSLDGCVGDAVTMNIAVKPIPTLTAINNQNLCAGANITAINFNSTPSNTTISWTNSLPSIGLTATGTGDIASFAAVNTSSSTQTATITAIPSLDGCVGDAITMNIAVKPIPTLTAINNQSLCADANTAAINFNSTPSNAIINWTNSLPSIGLSATGTGNIASFVALNNSSSTQTASITATPTLDGCVGDAITMSIAVKPIPSLAAINNQSLCAGANTAAINFTSTPSNAIINWTNSLPSIGLAASGTGNIASFVAVNTSSSTQTATITATPSLDGCVGDAITMNIAVKPIPSLVAINNQSLCAGSNTAAINFNSTPSNAIINWTNSLPSIGLAATGTGDIASFAAVNTSSSTQTATINATPSLDGCVGDAVTMNIAVKPIPVFAALANQNLCAGSNTAAINFASTPSNAIINWTNSLPSIGLAATGTGDIASFVALNNSSSTQTSTITATPSLDGCVGDAVTMNIAVKPIPTLTAINNQSLCAGSNTAAINFNSTPSNAIINWTNSLPSIGLTATGSGNIASFVAVNASSSTQTSTITATPSLDGCVGDAITMNIAVKPIPVLAAVANQNLCAGANTAAINFASTPNAATVNWTNSMPSIGLAATGTGNIASFVAVNTSASTQTATITATPSLDGCVGDAVTLNITVKPIPVLASVANQNLCAGANTAAINFASTPNGATINWTNSIPSIGLSASGTGNIASFVAVNTSSSTQTATITATPTLDGCVGDAVTMNIAVKPIPVLATVANQNLCAGSNTAAINFTSTPSNAIVSWTNSLPFIGLAATGSGNIASFAAVNTSSSTQTASITATPSLDGCVGDAITMSIAVKPIPSLVAINNQSLCAGSNTAAINFTSTPNGATVNWTNSLPSIGLAATGTGDIASFVALNNSSSTQTAIITATPSLDGCVGDAITMNIAVKPIPTLTAINNQSLCADANTAAINFNSTPSNTTISWTNSLPSIGLSTSGTSNIASFAAVNTSSSTQTATITATPSLDGCVGDAITMNIAVKPIPVLAAVTNQNLCAGANTAAINFASTPNGATVNWTNSLPSIGLAAAGTGNIASFIAVNASSTLQTTTITATPSLDGCVGDAITMSIAVKPIPVLAAVANQNLCAGANTAAINFTSTPNGATVNWTNSLPSIGLSASGTGNIASFAAVNTSSSTQAATITATPSFNGCVGDAITMNIAVKPIPTLTAINNQNLCAGANTAAINFYSTPSNATINWTNSLPSIGLAATGTGDIASFLAVNNSSSTQIATITATPSLDGCVGDAITMSIAVKPIPSLTAINNQSLCSGANTAAINFSSTPSNAIVSWTNSLPSIGLAATGTGNISSFVAVNASSTIQTTTITATPSLDGCVGDAVTMSIAVKPIPVLAAVSNQNLCAGANTAAINFTSTPSNAIISWTNSLPSIGLFTPGAGNIASFAAVNTSTSTQTASITATPSLDGCVGNAITMSIEVKPIPVLAAVANQNLCAGANTAAINFYSTPSNATINWTNSLPSIGLSASGTGNIASIVALNNSSSTQTATITATPSLDGCVGDAITMSIAVKPIPVLAAVSNQNLCAGANTTAINFNSTPSNTTISWTNSLPSIGLAATGNGNIASFVAVNATSLTQVATITATPSLDGCVGVPVPVQISVQPRLDFNVPNPIRVCSGSRIDPILLQSNVEGTIFSWTNDRPDLGLFAIGNGNIPSFIASNTSNQPQRIQIRVEGAANQCPAVVKTINIQIDPKPLLDQPVDQVVCADVRTNELRLRSSIAAAQIRWTNNNPAIGLSTQGLGDIPSFTAINNQLAPISATINIHAVVNRCNSDSMTFRIVVNPRIELDSIFDLQSCQGLWVPTIQFNTNIPETQISWTNNNPSIGLLPSGIGDIPRFLAINNGRETQTAEIQVVAVSPFGCPPAEKQFRIDVGATPSLIAQSTLNVCRGNVAQLSAQGAVRYNWTPSTPLTCPTCSTTDARIQDTTDFIVEGFNAMGCRKKDTVRVNVIQPFRMKTVPGDTVCQGQSVQLLAEKATTYQWYPSTGLSASNIANPIATPNTNIRYMVIGKDGYNCFSDTGYVNLVVASTPIVNAGPDVQAPSGTQIQLNASVQSSQAVSWNWTPSAGLTCTQCPNPKVTITANKTYVVSVQNANGCMAKDTLNVISFCKGAEIFVANAFTPDGDGVNDVLVVRGVGITVRSFRVFNRWGNLVFEKRMIPANDYKNGWDGRVKGVLAAPDVYVYTVEVVCDNGEVFFHKGNTTLLK